MGNKKIITIFDEKKERHEVEVLSSFKLNESGKSYVIYTKNEVDNNGNVTIYSYEFDKENNQFITISDDMDWTRIKEIIRDMSKISKGAK